MNKIITIIIPIFNGEKFIERCLDSIIGQDVDKSLMDVLVIDDGSSDGSIEKINEYARRYPELFTVIRKDNSGVADTRNFGMSMVKTKFLTFVDQDDWLDCDFLKKSLQVMTDDVDVAQGGFNIYNGNRKKIRSVYPIATEFGKFLAMPAWSKIYRVEFLHKNKIEFFDNNIGEDNIFTVSVIKKIKKGRYKTIKHAGYNHFDNSGNVTNSLHKGLSPKVNFIRLMDELYKISRDDSLLEYNIIRTAYYYLLSYGKYATVKRFIEFDREIDRWFNKKQINVYENIWLWRRLKGEKISVKIGIRLFLVIKKAKLTKMFATMYVKRRFK